MVTADLKDFGVCQRCGGALLADHECRPRTLPLMEQFTTPPRKPAVDWHAVARDAAVAYMASIRADSTSVGSLIEWAVESCEAALKLVAEMQKRKGFGGATSGESTR